MGNCLCVHTSGQQVECAVCKTQARMGTIQRHWTWRGVESQCRTCASSARLQAILERQERERLAAIKARKYPRASLGPATDLKTIDSTTSWRDTPSFRHVEPPCLGTLPEHGHMRRGLRRRLSRRAAAVVAAEAEAAAAEAAAATAADAQADRSPAARAVASPGLGVESGLGAEPCQSPPKGAAELHAALAQVDAVAAAARPLVALPSPFDVPEQHSPADPALLATVDLLLALEGREQLASPFDAPELHGALEPDAECMVGRSVPDWDSTPGSQPNSLICSAKGEHGEEGADNADAELPRRLAALQASSSELGFTHGSNPVRVERGAARSAARDAPHEAVARRLERGLKGSVGTAVLPCACAGLPVIGAATCAAGGGPAGKGSTDMASFLAGPTVGGAQQPTAVGVRGDGGFASGEPSFRFSESAVPEQSPGAAACAAGHAPEQALPERQRAEQGAAKALENTGTGTRSQAAAERSQGAAALKNPDTGPRSQAAAPVEVGHAAEALQIAKSWEAPALQPWLAPACRANCGRRKGTTALESPSVGHGQKSSGGGGLSTPGLPLPKVGGVGGGSWHAEGVIASAPVAV